MSHHESFIARQPILTADLNVYGYELLFRSGPENVFKAVCPNYATSKLLTDSMALIGLEALTGGRRGFVNFTEDLIVQGYPELTPRDWVVVEVLEDVEPTPDVLRALSRLKDLGYTIAFDDFVDSPALERLLHLADIIKVDFMATTPFERVRLARKYGARGIQMLAEKVEDRVTFEQAMTMGYTLFQGYFFAKPQMITRGAVPECRMRYLEILREANRDPLDFDRLEGLVRQEVSLSFKLLRYINSSFFATRQEIGSIKQALVMLGERDLRKWISFVAIAALGDGQPQELAAQALFRARFCELIAQNNGDAVGGSHDGSEHGDNAFMTGLFSLLDAMMQRPLQEIIADIPLVADVKEALLGVGVGVGSGGGGGDVKAILDGVRGYETADWDRVRESLGRIDQERLPVLYAEALQFAQSASS